MDVDAFEAALSGWTQQQLGRRVRTIAVDGKALRGSHGEQVPGVDLVAGYADAAGLVLAQAGVRREQQAGELRTAMQLLGMLPLGGRLLTGEALYCQRDFCRDVVAAGGDYLVTVKQNQPAL